MKIAKSREAPSVIPNQNVQAMRKETFDPEKSSHASRSFAVLV
jgi:hypothetical protein